MADFECTCSVTKGERTLAWGDDCYAYYPKPNYGERIVRCRDCAYYAKSGHCMSDWFFLGKVTNDGFCKWGVPKEG